MSLPRPQEDTELHKLHPYESRADANQHIYIISSNIIHMELKTDYHCKCNFGLNYLHDSSWLLSLMKATLATKGKPLSNPECKRGSCPDLKYSWHNENKIIILILLLISLVCI